ncbi:unnamed protein product [Prorocentrum cordatum]|uniref:Uncharacterized protein n=2 Tax=Prorocentrum cordatum TaxID=2364126 RepID=A0ABN9VP72_9DINO|nr:unnamed protein product [Polarella glacialis]
MGPWRRARRRGAPASRRHGVVRPERPRGAGPLRGGGRGCAGLRRGCRLGLAVGGLALGAEEEAAWGVPLRAPRAGTVPPPAWSPRRRREAPRGATAAGARWSRAGRDSATTAATPRGSATRRAGTRRERPRCYVPHSTRSSKTPRCTARTRATMSSSAGVGPAGVDDVIMNENCKAAYVHVGAAGSKLEVRQTIVWLVRNAPQLRTALARRYKHRARIPKMYFVESKFREWERQLEKARQIPELNLPDPLARIREKLSLENRLKKMGMGDPDKPIRKYGYGKAF